MQDSSKLLGPDGQPLTSAPRIIVVKSRDTLSPQLIQHIGMVTKSSVIVLPLEIDLMMGQLAMEEIEAVHCAIHDILELEKKFEEGKQVNHDD